MLDDRERRIWQDIEGRLAADDPGFGAGMRGADRPRWSAAPALWVATFYVVTVVLWLLAGWTTAVIGAVAFLILLPVVVCGMWHRQAARGHGPDDQR